MPALRRGVDRSRMSWPPRRLAAFIRTVASSIAVLGLLLTVHASATSVAAGTGRARVRASPSPTRPAPASAIQAGLRAAIPPSSPASVVSATVLLVHGFAPNGTCPGVDNVAYWGGLQSVLHNLRPGEPVVPISYYRCDKAGTPIGSFTRDDDIAAISLAFADYVYRTYTARGRSVDVISHSMGGLVVRYALQHVAMHDPRFPRQLMVQQAVAVSAPFDGADPAYASPAVCAAIEQCEEFTSGSQFLRSLSADPDPQGTGGTDWTAVGGGDCDVLSVQSATDMPGAHRVWWTAPCYSHNGVLNDANPQADAIAFSIGAGSSDAVRTTDQYHSDYFIARALSTDTW